MRTTIDIPDEVFREIKVEAAMEGKTFREVAVRRLRRKMPAEESTPNKPKKFEIPVIRFSQPGALNLTPEEIDEIAFS